MRDLRSHFAGGRPLTEQQLVGQVGADHDLATAYPVLPLPVDLIELVAHYTREILMAGTNGVCTPGIGSSAERSLVEAASSLLRMPPESSCVRITMTGSIAIDRAFRGVEIMAQQRGSSGVHVITSEPSVDIARQILAERRGISVDTVRLSHTSPESDVREVLSAIKRSQKPTPLRTITVVFLTSPNNPTGRVWAEHELVAIATELGATDGVLIVDHSLLVAGMHYPKVPPAIWNVGSVPCDWMGIWDTGKTIDLRGDKIALMAIGGADLAAAVDKALQVLQFGPSQRAAEVFTRLLQHPSLDDYLSELGCVCRRNLAVLYGQVPTAVNPPGQAAGTVAWLDLAGSGQTSETWRRQWLVQGVATVTGDAFFAQTPYPRTYLRVALARPEDRFASAMGRVRGRHHSGECGQVAASAVSRAF